MDSEETRYQYQTPDGAEGLGKRLLRTKWAIIIGAVLVLSIALGALLLFSQQREEQSRKELSKGTPLQTVPTIPFPTPTPDMTGSWKVLTNTNGISVKYPTAGTVLPDEKTATNASSFQVLPIANKPASEQSILGVEIISKTDAMIAGKSLLEIVNLVREKNTNSQILTKPISILFGGNDGYEWYLKSSTFTGIKNSFTAKEGKQRIIQFEKNNTHYIILSTFDDSGEQLLSTLKINQ